MVVVSGQVPPITWRYLAWIWYSRDNIYTSIPRALDVWNIVLARYTRWTSGGNIPCSTRNIVLVTPRTLLPGFRILIAHVARSPWKKVSEKFAFEVSSILTFFVRLTYGLSASRSISRPLAVCQVLSRYNTDLSTVVLYLIAAYSVSISIVEILYNQHQVRSLTSRCLSF